MGRLDVAVSFGAGEVVVNVCGDVDLVTVDDLEAIVTAVLRRPHASVTIDLAGASFQGETGYRVLATGARRLAASGRRLSIRSPPLLVSQMFVGEDLADLVEVEHPARPGAEQMAGVTTAAAGGLFGHLKRATAVADDEMVDRALDLVVNLARATLGGADGVSVSLRRHGQLRTVAASDQTILDMDADQYATGEGPCVDASVEGRWFHADALDQETRWPSFTPKARALGINAILSSPLLAGDRPVGALNIYSRTAAAFAARDQALASTFAGEASRLLSSARAGSAEDELSDRLSLALRTRRTIAHAQGVLMEREGIGASEAYTLLRTFSQETSQPLSQRAADIARSTRSSSDPASDGEAGPCPAS